MYPYGGQGSVQFPGVSLQLIADVHGGRQVLAQIVQLHIMWTSARDAQSVLQCVYV